MGAISRNNKQVGQSKGYVVIGLIGMLVILGGFFVYRSGGYLVSSQSFSRVEDTADFVNTANGFFDYEEGVSYEDAEVVKDAAKTMREEIKDLGEGDIFFSKIMGKELQAREQEVRDLAVDYLKSVEDLADKCLENEDTWEESDELKEMYDQYKEAVEDYSDELESFNRKHLLSL